MKYKVYDLKENEKTVDLAKGAGELPGINKYVRRCKLTTWTVPFRPRGSSGRPNDVMHLRRRCWCWLLPFWFSLSYGSNWDPKFGSFVLSFEVELHFWIDSDCNFLEVLIEILNYYSCDSTGDLLLSSVSNFFESDSEFSDSKLLPLQHSCSSYDWDWDWDLKLKYCKYPCIMHTFSTKILTSKLGVHIICGHICIYVDCWKILYLWFKS